MSDQSIKGIFGPEPMRDGEYPNGFIVGSPAGAGRYMVKRIVRRNEYHGDHDVEWFDIFADVDGEETRIASLNHRFIAEVMYVVEG